MRAVAAAVCGNDMKDLRGGSFLSAVPHIMAHIVPRQMVEDGDPNRRSCEQSEAIGVDLKFDLHKRCARNHTTKRVTRNARGEIIKVWRAKLKISRVMQVQTAVELPNPCPHSRPHAQWLACCACTGLQSRVSAREPPPRRGVCELLAAS